MDQRDRIAELIAHSHDQFPWATPYKGFRQSPNFEDRRDEVMTLGDIHQAANAEKAWATTRPERMAAPPPPVTPLGRQLGQHQIPTKSYVEQAIERGEALAKPRKR